MMLCVMTNFVTLASLNHKVRKKKRRSSFAPLPPISKVQNSNQNRVKVTQNCCDSEISYLNTYL